MRAVAHQLHGIVSICDQLAQISGGAVKYLMGPHLDVISPFRGHLAVVLYDAALGSRRIEKRIDSRLNDLIHVQRNISWREGRGKLVKA